MSPLILTMVFAQLVKQSPWLIKPLTGLIRAGVTKEYIACRPFQLPVL